MHVWKRSKRTNGEQFQRKRNTMMVAHSKQNNPPYDEKSQSSLKYLAVDTTTSRWTYCGNPPKLSNTRILRTWSESPPNSKDIFNFSEGLLTVVTSWDWWLHFFTLDHANRTETQSWISFKNSHVHVGRRRLRIS